MSLKDGFDGLSENPDNPHTPASEPARSQPPSPQKKKRKVNRSQSIPAQSPMTGGGFAPPNVYAPGHADAMMPPHPYDDRMHGNPMTSPGMHHMNPSMGHHPGHPMMPTSGHMPPHMQHPMPQQHPGGPGHLGHPMHPPTNGRFMRPGPGPIPPHHMAPTGQPMHPQGINPQMNNPPGHGPGPMHQYSPGIAINNRPYPPEQQIMFNPTNHNVPPIYHCGICHKEISDGDQAIMCESGCNLWFHRHCSGLSDHAFQLLTKEIYAEWVCNPCYSKKKVPLIKLKP